MEKIRGSGVTQRSVCHTDKSLTPEPAETIRKALEEARDRLNSLPPAPVGGLRVDTSWIEPALEALAVIEDQSARHAERVAVLEGERDGALAMARSGRRMGEMLERRLREADERTELVIRENAIGYHRLKGRLADAEAAVEAAAFAARHYEGRLAELEREKDELTGGFMEAQERALSAESKLSEATDTLKQRDEQIQRLEVGYMTATDKQFQLDAEVKNLTEALARQRKFCPDCGAAIFPLTDYDWKTRLEKYLDSCDAEDRWPSSVTIRQILENR